MTRSISLLPVLALTLLMMRQACSLGEDHNQKLLLNSDKANLNLETGISIYNGNVTLQQGTTHLLADKLTVLTNKQNQLQQITAIGNPAQYRTLPQPNKPEFHADANIIEYYPQKNLIVLIGNAQAYQNRNVYKGPRIEYNTIEQTVTSPESAMGRTTIIIEQKQPIANAIIKDTK